MDKTMSILNSLVRWYERMFVTLVPNGIIRVDDRERYLLPLKKDGEPKSVRILCQCGGVSNTLSVFADEVSYLSAISKLHLDNKAKALFYFYPQDGDKIARVMGYCRKCGSPLSAKIVLWINME